MCAHVIAIFWHLCRNNCLLLPFYLLITLFTWQLTLSKQKKKWQPCRFRIILDWFSLIFYRVLEHFFKNGLKRIVQCFFLTFKFFWSPFWRRIMLPLKHDDLVSNRGIFKRIKEKLTGWFRLIWSDPNSRNLLGFLVLNLSFAFVELFYGVWTNSLGLISDSFHMFFDCTGLLAGLVRV